MGNQSGWGSPKFWIPVIGAVVVAVIGAYATMASKDHGEAKSSNVPATANSSNHQQGGQTGTSTGNCNFNGGQVQNVNCSNYAAGAPPGKTDVKQPGVAASPPGNLESSARDDRRPVIVTLDPKITESDGIVAVTFRLQNAGERIAFVDLARFSVGPIVEPRSSTQEPLESFSGCQTIWGVRSMPVGSAFEIRCYRRITEQVAAMLRMNSWVRVTGDWNYHDQEDNQWQGGDEILCSTISGECGPSPDHAAYNRAVKGKWSGSAPQGYRAGD